MSTSQPYSIPDCRELRNEERDLVAYILKRHAPEMLAQLPSLKVIARCGCGHCPTILFGSSFSDERADHDAYREIASYFGKDSYGGLVGVCLFESKGRIAELEFFSYDGHDPWGAPPIDHLQPLE